jgi:uncharacterized membrane protein
MGMKFRKVPLIFLILAMLNLITMFTAPFTIPPNSVSGLDGNANIIDHSDLWGDLNPYAALVYTMGDFSCHQKESRSFFLNDNQMPVCARDVGLAFGFIIGAVLFAYSIPNSDPFVMSLTPFLREKTRSMGRKKIIVLSVLIASIFTIPIAFDGLRQTFTSYESTNPVRLATGLLFGWVVVLGMGVYLESYIFKHLYDKKNLFIDE